MEQDHSSQDLRISPRRDASDSVSLASPLSAKPHVTPPLTPRVLEDEAEVVKVPSDRQVEKQSEKPSVKFRRKNSVYNIGNKTLAPDKTGRVKVKLPTSPTYSADGDAPKSALQTLRCMLLLLADAKELFLGGGEPSWQDTEFLSAVIRSMESGTHLTKSELEDIVSAQSGPLTADQLLALVNEQRKPVSLDLTEVYSSSGDSDSIFDLASAIESYTTRSSTLRVTRVDRSSNKLGRRSSFVADRNIGQRVWKGIGWAARKVDMSPVFESEIVKLCNAILDEQQKVKCLIVDVGVIQRRAIKNRGKLLVSFNHLKECVSTLQTESSQLGQRLRKLESDENLFRETQRADLSIYHQVAIGDKDVNRMMRKCEKKDDDLHFMAARVGPFIAKMKEIDEQIQALQINHQEKRKLQHNLESAQEVTGLLHEVLQTMADRTKAGAPNLDVLCEYSSMVQDILGTL